MSEQKYECLVEVWRTKYDADGAIIETVSTGLHWVPSDAPRTRPNGTYYTAPSSSHQGPTVRRVKE